MNHADHTSPEPVRMTAIVIRAAIGIAILGLVLNLPVHPADLKPLTLLRLPLEVPLVVALLLALKGCFFRALRFIVTLAASLVLLLKLADLGTNSAFSRPFNPLLDARLLTDGWNLLSGSVGRFEAIAVIASALLCWIFVAFLLYWALGALRLTRRPHRLIAVVALFFAIGLVGNITARQPQVPDLRADLRVLPFITERVALMQRSIVDMQAFERDLEHDPLSSLAPNQRLTQLEGVDVVVIFVESYGASTITDPRYAPITLPRLESIQTELERAGMASRSSWLVSPTSGGLSWLAHGALLAGAWTDSQQRYDRLIASDRQSLNAIFRDRGWQSVAVMPAIVMDWPESGYFGYDHVLAAADLGYKGLPFNWVTMPDQYTLAAFERKQRASTDRPAIFAEIALISSHAPWTPVPKLIDWDAVGDGTVFNEQARSGESPAAVWSDENRVRNHFIRTIDYSLETLGSYMARFGDNTLFVVLGDHQPAPIITGQNASRAVPVHVVARDARLLERLAGPRWTPGMTPAPDETPRRMDAFREDFVRSFSDQAD